MNFIVMGTNNTRLSVRFLGAAGTVTGSRYLLSGSGINILVDCGLFQGLKKLRELNWKELPFPPKEIDAVVLTHAHLDHCGYLPRLVKQGFNNPVYCTGPTRELAEIILTDSAKIQEEDAEHANRHGYSKRSPALPLYDQKDVEHTLPMLDNRPDESWIGIGENLRFMFRRVAHIPGASFIQMEIGGKRLVFSGDVGRPNDPMLFPPEKPENADILFIESTYGDRLHPDRTTDEVMTRIIHESLDRKGTLLIPSFTVDRAQDFMYVIWKLKHYGKIPDVPVYFDSPMGDEVSRVFLQFPHWNKLGGKILNEVFGSIKTVHTLKENQHLAENQKPKIIIAGSGMMNGGRILHYLKRFLEDPRSTVIIPGFQAAGTRGRMISEGVNEVKIHGGYYKVKAHIEHIRTMSSHADQSELIGWLSELKSPPEKIFIVHGEHQSSDALRVKIRDIYGWEATVPELYQEFQL